MAGAHPNRNWPAFFEKGFGVPVTPLASPGFSYRRQRRVDLPSTLWNLARRLPAYRRSLARLRATLHRTRPDLVINFLEPLAGWAARDGRIPVSGGNAGGGVPVLAVGHQYMLTHPGYPRAKGDLLGQWGLRRYVQTTGRGTLRYALSFYDAPPEPGGRTIVAPPLLRDDLLRLHAGPCGDHILVYLLNAGYLAELEAWQARAGRHPLEVFCDRPGAPVFEQRPHGVTVHQLDAHKFLSLMQTSRGVVCSAGFESLSEAAWLGRPALAIPVQGHIEQRLNALDFERTGLGASSSRFELGRLPAPGDSAAHERFRRWVRQSDACLDGAVARACQPLDDATRHLWPSDADSGLGGEMAAGSPVA